MPQALIVGRSQQLNPIYGPGYRQIYQQKTKIKAPVLASSSLEPSKMQMYLPAKDSEIAASGLHIQAQMARERPIN